MIVIDQLLAVSNQFTAGSSAGAWIANLHLNVNVTVTLLSVTVNIM